KAAGGGDPRKKPCHERHRKESELKNSWQRLKEEWGATAVEYGLLVAGIAIVIATAVFLFGGRLRGVFQRLAGLF
ncbi:MAG: Flp family type IVb pilin, partial [Nitrospira sp.]|nr:Flp family type IVb pilin [Nitrospira sp.]